MIDQIDDDDIAPPAPDRWTEQFRWQTKTRNLKRITVNKVASTAQMLWRTLQLKSGLRASSQC